jgi:hypothetical protein
VVLEVRLDRVPRAGPQVLHRELRGVAPLEPQAVELVVVGEAGVRLRLGRLGDVGEGDGVGRGDGVDRLTPAEGAGRRHVGEGDRDAALAPVALGVGEVEHRAVAAGVVVGVGHQERQRAVGGLGHVQPLVLGDDLEVAAGVPAGPQAGVAVGSL